MKKCEYDKCKKSFNPKHPAQKYCKPQSIKGSCGYKALADRSKSEARYHTESKVCLGCNKTFKTNIWNKVRCGDKKNPNSCVGKYAVEWRQIHKQKIKKELATKPKLAVVEPPKEEPKHREEVFMTPRLAQLEFMKRFCRYTKYTRTTRKED